MAWKKAWPTPVKKQLKELGISDKNIAVLEQYSSLKELREDPKKALGKAKSEAVVSALKEAGLF